MLYLNLPELPSIILFTLLHIFYPIYLYAYHITVARSPVQKEGRTNSDSSWFSINHLMMIKGAILETKYPTWSLDSLPGWLCDPWHLLKLCIWVSSNIILGLQSYLWYVMFNPCFALWTENTLWSALNKS